MIDYIAVTVWFFLAGTIQFKYQNWVSSI